MSHPQIQLLFIYFYKTQPNHIFFFGFTSMNLNKCQRLLVLICCCCNSCIHTHSFQYTCTHWYSHIQLFWTSHFYSFMVLKEKQNFCVWCVVESVAQLPEKMLECAVGTAVRRTYVIYKFIRIIITIIIIRCIQTHIQSFALNYNSTNFL